MRISPYGALHGMKSDDAVEDVYEALAREMSAIGLVHLHLVDLSSMGKPEVKPSVRRKVRDAFRGTLILSGGYDRDRAEGDLVEKKADLVAFGRPFLANPRLVTRLRERRPLAAADPETFYTPGVRGLYRLSRGPELSHGLSLRDFCPLARTLFVLATNRPR
jgi:N-ethylmaleimide reductase